MIKKLLLACAMSFFFSCHAFALQVGDVAPGFKAQSTHGTLELKELRKQGPVILAFYYADFTPL